MRRICVFVEGQTELIFVREFLLKWYHYSDVCIRCFHLRAGHYETAEYDFGNLEASNTYQIIDVGNDNMVLSIMIKRAEKLISTGFNLVIGLRDMYSQAYRLKSSTINEAITKSFIETANSTLKESVPASIHSQISIHYAIMEVESWILALSNALQRANPELTREVMRKVGVLPAFRIEREIFHPAETLDVLMRKCGKSYDKHKDQVNSIIAAFTKEDFIYLYKSNASQSYNKFIIKIVDI